MGTSHRLEDLWPIFGLRLTCGEVVLRHVREVDLAHLAAMQPDDYEHDPSAEPFPGQQPRPHRQRLVCQGYWRSVGNWSPARWCLDFVVEHGGAVVGVQSLESERFLDLRTVDSTSWLIESARGRGIGVAMRQAVLALAFNHLGARVAVSSARAGNAASLGVSRRLGYRDNGISLNVGDRGVTELQHLRLTREEWAASGRSDKVDVVGLEPCLPWFGIDPPG